MNFKSPYIFLTGRRLPGDFKHKFHGHEVFKFFQEEKHADALAAGQVWLSTLEKCRQYEDPLQGDPGEAEHTYRSGTVTGNSGDPLFDLIAARSGIGMIGCTNATISEATNTTYLRDAFVICTTAEFDPKKLGPTFGRYCVRISYPNEFFWRVSEVALRRHQRIAEAHWGSVEYRERDYAGVQPEPGLIGFVKPSDKYAAQKEVRFLWWQPGADALTPNMLDVPAAAELCKRIA